MAVGGPSRVRGAWDSLNRCRSFEVNEQETCAFGSWVGFIRSGGERGEEVGFRAWKLLQKKKKRKIKIHKDIKKDSSSERKFNLITLKDLRNYPFFVCFSMGIPF